MSNRVLKWVVPVDDQPHTIGGGPILHVGHQGNVNEVVVWTEEPVKDPTHRKAIVVGTGHPYEGHAMGSVVHLAGSQPSPFSTDRMLGNLVWHLVVLP